MLTTQLFEITVNKEAKSIDMNKAIGDIIDEKNVYLIVNDDQKMIWLYKGLNSGIKIQFIGNMVQKRMKMQLRGFYGTKDFNLPKESELYVKIMSSKPGNGRAKEILKTDNEMKAEDQISKAQDAVDSSRARETCVHKDVISKLVIPEALELENPLGFHRNMALICGSAFSEVTVIDKFLTEDKKKRDLHFLGKLPNGFFFIEDVSTRVFIKKGKVQCIDLMVANDQFLGSKKIMVPVLLKDKFNHEGDMNILLNSFVSPEDDIVKKPEDAPSNESEKNPEIEEDKTVEGPN